MSQTWDELKKEGSGHYRGKENATQPIDLYKDGGMFRDFALASIVKYAYRQRRQQREKMEIKDLHKIRHYTELLIALCSEEA
jgi:hypothetical protein